MTPAEKKASELAKLYAEEIPEMETSEFTGEGVYRIKDIEKSFEAGFRAALELAEVKGLEEALKQAESEFNEKGYCDMTKPLKALTAWRSFRGEK